MFTFSPATAITLVVGRHKIVEESTLTFPPGHYVDETTDFCTNGEFQAMCEVFLEFPSTPNGWTLHTLSATNTPGPVIPRNSEAMMQGRYIILDDTGQVIPVNTSSEPIVQRTRTPRDLDSDSNSDSDSESSSKLRHNERHFQDTVLARDGNTCVISGRSGPLSNPALTVQAAHVFPVSRLNLWERDGCKDWITDTTAAHYIEPQKMFSAQNGLTLRADVHNCFDAFQFTVNPDV